MEGVGVAFVFPGSGPVFEDFGDEVGDGFVGVEARAEIEGGLEELGVVGAEVRLGEDGG